MYFGFVTVCILPLNRNVYKDNHSNGREKVIPIL